FWNRSRCQFQLQELACQHLGFSGNYEASNLKRKMLPGIRELETRGYLAAVPDAERFRKIRAGEWLVRFEEGKGVRPIGCSQEAAPTSEPALVQALIAR